LAWMGEPDSRPSRLENHLELFTRLRFNDLQTWAWTGSADMFQPASALAVLYGSDELCLKTRLARIISELPE